MYELKRYTPEFINEWNSFVEKAKNGTFLLNRNFMDYHSCRFQDNSFLFYRKEKLCALLPANRVSNVLYSHQGLTHGGFIMSPEIRTIDVMAGFELLNEKLRGDGFTKVIYKPMPYIYHQIPAQEDLYALFRNNPQIVERNISSTIYQKNKSGFIKMRRVAVHNAINNKIEVCESENYAGFWGILVENLKERHGVRPVHSSEEISLLHSRFPDNIKLYLACRDNDILGGVVVFITKQVVHAQYCSANLIGKELGALDLLFDYLINVKYVNIPIFDFGQSTEKKGQYLNEGLIFQKEGFGARGIVYDVYEYSL